MDRHTDRHLATRICFRTPSVFAVCSTDVWHHCIIRTVQPQLCWWFPVVHQRAGIRITDGCSPVGYMCQRSRSLDGVQQTEIECREDSANLDSNWATACLADHHSTPADKLDCWVWQYASNLGMVLDSQLSMSQHVTAVCRSCFYQLRQLKSVKSSLTRDSPFSYTGICSL